MKIFHMDTSTYLKICILALINFSATEGEMKANKLYQSRIGEAWEAPYQVSLHLNYNDEFLCGGTIISDNKVLTLAHCLYYSWGGIIPPIILSVKAGGNNFFADTSQNYDVANITFHEKFNTYSMDYDLSVIEVATKFSYLSSTVDKIPVLVNFSPGYNNCAIAGWDKESGDLMITTVDLLKYETTDKGKIYAGNSELNNTLCRNSIGSSLVCDGYLLGLLSVIQECNTNNTLKTAVFENVRGIFGYLDIRNSAVVITNVRDTILLVVFTVILFIINLFL